MTLDPTPLHRVLTLAGLSAVLSLFVAAGPALANGAPTGPAATGWREAVEAKADAYATYLAGVEAARAGRLEEARQRLERVLEIDPDAAQVRAALAEVCFEQGDRVCAENEAERAMGRDDAAAGQAHEVMAKLELQRHRASNDPRHVEAAIEHLRRATELRPREPWAWNVWISLLVREERIEEAEGVARRAAAVPGADAETPWQTFARSLLEVGRREQAIELLDELNASGEALDSLVELMAQLKEQAGDMEGYAQALTRLRELRPGDAEVAHRLGKARLGQGDPFAALEPLRAAQRARPGDPMVRRDLASALVELGRAEQAVELLEELPSVYLSPHTLFLWVRAEEQLGRWQQAAERLETLIDALAEEDREAYGDAFVVRAARDYMKAGQPEDALRLIEPLGKTPLVLRLRLQALENSGRAEQARERLAQARRARPEDPALLALELDRELAGDTPPATQTIVQRAVEGSPSEDAVADYGLRVALALIGWERAETGAAILDRLPRPDGCATDWLRTAASAYYQAGRLDAAEALYREVLGCAPDNHGAMNDLCYLLADERGEVEEALRLCRMAVDAQPDEPSYLDSLGWALHLAGRSEEALPLLQRAVSESRETARGDIREHLGDVYAALGRTERALAEWRAALALAGGEGTRLREKIESVRSEERDEP